MALQQSTGVSGTSVASTISITFGTAPSSGDIIILAVSQGANGSGSATCSGFSAIPGISLLTLPWSGDYMSFLYKVAGASEPTTYTVTLGSGNYAALQGWDFSGRNTTSPFTAVSSNTIALGASPLSIALAGVTAAAGDDVLWVGSMGTSTAPTFGSAPAGFTNQLNTSGSTISEKYASGAVHTNVSSGATGTLTVTATWSGGNDDAAGAVISLAAIGGNFSGFKLYANGAFYAPAFVEGGF